jgi:hypothetical protein
MTLKMSWIILKGANVRFPPRVPIGALLVAFLAFCGVSRCPAQSAPAPQDLAGNEQKGESASLQKVLDLIDAYKHGDLNADEFVPRLPPELDFIADGATLTLFREKGATEPMIEEIKKRAKKETPKGAIAVKCDPGECKIYINGKFSGPTSGGHFKQGELKAGQAYTIDLQRDGYITGQKTVTAAVEPVAEVEVALDPTPDTTLLMGKKLFALMMRALGDNLKTLASLTASGSASTYQNGKPTAWEFNLSTAPPRLIEMRVSSSLGSLSFGCKDLSCSERKKGVAFLKSGTKLPPAVVGDLETSLKLISTFNLVSILETVNISGMRITARTADSQPKGDQRFEAEGTDAIYVFTIGSDYLPRSVEYRPRAGLGAAKTTYGSYQKLGESSYPKHTIIVLAQAADSGIEFQLDQLELGSKLRPADFR